MELMHIVAVVLGALLALSEALSLIPSVKSNSVFQLIVNALKKAKSVVSKPKEAE